MVQTAHETSVSSGTAPRIDPPTPVYPPITTPGLNWRAEVTITPRSADPPQDNVVSVVHFNGSGSGFTPAQWQTNADTVRDVFRGFIGSFQTYNARLIQVKVYNLADPLPRPIKATSTFTPGVPESGSLGPRHVALCCSFYSAHNTPHLRGRIYVGPFNQAEMNERPTTLLMNNVLALGIGLRDQLQTLTAPSLFSVYSRTTGQLNAVTNVWCNDVWDEVHERLPKESTRVHNP